MPNLVYSVTDSNGSSNAVVLVHGPASASSSYAQGPIDELTFNALQALRVVPVTRATNAKVFHRSNHNGSLVLRAERQFSTHIEAVAFAAQHMLSVQGKPILKITDGTTTLYFKGGVAACNATPVGVAVKLEYQYTYGEVTTSL